jgi:hypothetical protein
VQLCEFVLENATKMTLVLETLRTLLKFLNWIPLGYIFETKLIDRLLYKARASWHLTVSVSVCVCRCGG